MKKSQLIALGILTAACILTEPLGTFAAEDEQETEYLTEKTDYETMTGEEISPGSEETLTEEMKEEEDAAEFQEEPAAEEDQENETMLSGNAFVSMLLPYEDALLLYGEGRVPSGEPALCAVLLSWEDLRSLGQAEEGDLYSYEVLAEEPEVYLTADLKDGTLFLYEDSVKERETETEDSYQAANTETTESSEEEKTEKTEALETEEQESSSDSEDEDSDSNTTASSSKKKKSSSSKSSSKSSSSKSSSGSSSKESSGSSTEDTTSSGKHSSKKAKTAEETEQETENKEKAEHRSSSEKAEKESSGSQKKHKKKTKQADSGNAAAENAEQETDTGLYAAAGVLGLLSAVLVLYLKFKK